jgi:hypothetical protein
VIRVHRCLSESSPCTHHPRPADEIAWTRAGVMAVAVLEWHPYNEANGILTFIG